MDNLLKYTITQTMQLLQKRELSVTELMRAYINRDAEKKDLNATFEMNEQRVLKAAQQADERIAAGRALPLDGIPYIAKDLFCTKGVRTTAGSKILENFIPPYESTVTDNLHKNGAILLSKANMDEFAMGSSNETSYFGPVISPWRRADGKPLVPGGSSGGSAAAVAAYMAPAALGSDTGGSIRQPAAYCGIVGVKPTYGRCSRYGMVPFASSLDQAGVFARTVEDSAIILQVISGHDPKDSTSKDLPVPEWKNHINEGVKGLRIGVPKEYRVDGMTAEVLQMWERAADQLRQAGAEIVEISLAHTEYALPTYYVIAPAEASSNLMRYDGVRYGFRTPDNVTDLSELYSKTRAEGFGNEVKRRIMIGTHVLSAGYHDEYYDKAKLVRRLITQEFDNAFAKIDAILTPTAPTTAFAIGDKVSDPIAMHLNDVFTVPASLAGLPCISVPGGLAQDGLPLGLHVIAKRFDEKMMFRVAQFLFEANRVALPQQ